MAHLLDIRLPGHAVGRSRTSSKSKALPRYLYLRRKSYYFRSPIPPRTWTPLGADLRAALKKYAELLMATSAETMLVDAQLREAGVEPTRVRATLRDAWLRYEKLVLPAKAPRTQIDNHGEAKNLLAVFGAVALDDITPVHVRTYLDERGASARVRANREVALLSHVLNRAREWGLMTQPNPCAGVRKFTETGRDRYVDDQEYLAVWRAGDQLVRDVMGLAYLLGQRPGDVFRLRLSDVEGDAIPVEINKTRQKVRIQISGELAKLVTSLKERPRLAGVGALLVNERGEAATYEMFRNRFERARAAAGVHFQLRDLRAKNATDTNDLALAQKRLAHTSRKMTEHYVRSRQGELVAPLDRALAKHDDASEG